MMCPHATQLASIDTDWCADCGARRRRSVNSAGEVLAIGEWIFPRPRRPDGTVHSVEFEPLPTEGAFLAYGLGAMVSMALACNVRALDITSECDSDLRIEWRLDEEHAVLQLCVRP